MYPIRDTINEQPKEGLVARAVSRGTKDIKALAIEIAEGTTFNAAEVEAVLNILVQRVERLIKAGYRVKLGDLGTFFVSAGSRVVQDKDEIRAGSIKVKRVTYKSSRALTENMRDARFEREEKL
jgi:predicted histone-like DNA-binding protein